MVASNATAANRQTEIDCHPLSPRKINELTSTLACPLEQLKYLGCKRTNRYTVPKPFVLLLLPAPLCSSMQWRISESGGRVWPSIVTGWGCKLTNGSEEEDAAAARPMIETAQSKFCSQRAAVLYDNHVYRAAQFRNHELRQCQWCKQFFTSAILFKNDAIWPWKEQKFILVWSWIQYLCVRASDATQNTTLDFGVSVCVASYFGW